MSINTNMSISHEIRNYYRDDIAPVEYFPQRHYKEIPPISRFYFIVGAAAAVLLLVQKIVQSIFYLVATILTLGLNEEIKNSLLENGKKVPVYGGAIFLGIAGALFPQTINEEVLEIPAEGLKISTLKA